MKPSYNAHMQQKPSATAADYFGAMAESYDSLITRAVPRYREMTDRLIEYLPPGPQVTDILELGCGTGNLTLRLAERFPGAIICAVDASPEMVDVTKSRLQTATPSSSEAKPARFIVSRFEDLEVADRSFDVITSCISLHHVADKAALYARLHAAIRPGGLLCFADQLAGHSKFNNDLNWSRWLEFCRLPDHCTAEETQSLIDHAIAHDHYTPLAEHFRLLEQAGWTEVDCVWRNWMWGIVTAKG